MYLSDHYLMNDIDELPKNQIGNLNENSTDNLKTKYDRDIYIWNFLNRKKIVKMSDTCDDSDNRIEQLNKYNINDHNQQSNNDHLEQVGNRCCFLDSIYDTDDEDENKQNEKICDIESLEISSEDPNDLEMETKIHFTKLPNYPDEIIDLAQTYEKGTNIKQDYRKAFLLYLKSTEFINCNGFYNVGRCYNFGIGVEYDIEQAIKYYNIAIDLGSIEAKSLLGQIYYNGQDVEQDVEKAVQLFIDSLTDANGVSAFNLAQFYEANSQQIDDLTSSINALSFESDESNCNLKHNQNRYTVSAFNFYNLSASKGNIYAKYKIARCYEFGFGTDVNYEQAHKMYTQLNEETGEPCLIEDLERIVAKILNNVKL